MNLRTQTPSGQGKVSVNTESSCDAGTESLNDLYLALGLDIQFTSRTWKPLLLIRSLMSLTTVSACVLYTKISRLGSGAPRNRPFPGLVLPVITLIRRRSSCLCFFRKWRGVSKSSLRYRPGEVDPTESYELRDRLLISLTRLLCNKSD